MQTELKAWKHKLLSGKGKVMEHCSKIWSFLSSLFKKTNQNQKNPKGRGGWQHTTSLLLSLIQQTSQDIKITRQKNGLFPSITLATCQTKETIPPQKSAAYLKTRNKI